MNKLLIAIFSLLILAAAAGGIVGYMNRVNPLDTPPIETLGTFNTVGGKTYFLSGGGVGASDTTIVLTSFQVPVSNYPLVMSNFGDIGYLTLEPGSATRQEFVSFTGVTQNVNGTATLTGVTRGLSPVPPYTASTTIQKAHAGGSTVVISNPPQLYEQLATKQNAESITGIWDFSSTSVPRYDLVPLNHNTGTIVSTTSEFASAAYVNAVSAAGCADAAEGNQGCVELATALEAASSTSSGTEARLVIPASMATDTPQYGCAVGYTGTAGAGCSVIAALTGYIRQAWIDFTANFNFTGTTRIKSLVASTTVAFDDGGSSTSWIFPTGTHASSTIWMSNGSGQLFRRFPEVRVLDATSYANVTTSSTGTTTIYTTTIPANTLGTLYKVLRVTSEWNGVSGSTCFGEIHFGDGAATTTIGFSGGYGQPGAARIVSVIAATSTASAFATGLGTAMTVQGNFTSQPTYGGGKFSTTDLTAQSYIGFAGRSISGSEVCRLNTVLVELLSE